MYDGRMSSGGSTLSLHDGARRRPGDPVPQPQLIVALECSRPKAGGARFSLAGATRVLLGRGEDRGIWRHERDGATELELRIPDRWMSSVHARIERSFGRWILSDAGSKNGTRVRGEPADRAILEDGDMIELGHTLLRFRAAVPIGAGDPADLDLAATRPPVPGIETLVPSFARELTKLERLAPTQIAILLRGESGTGKEVLARAAHVLSGRKGPFVAVNCGAIPENLVESELFGHKKGAFSGATDDRLGLVRSADGGTLFLDEIGDLRLGSQAALLRVLQEREVLPVGANRPIPVDIRLVSATHRDLAQMVDAGEFRQDLFARIAGFRLSVPPLRERRDDIGHLVGKLLVKAAGEAHPGLEVDAGAFFLEHDWPLNVRQIETAISAAAALAGDEPIALEHLPDTIEAGRATARPPAPAVSEPLSADDARVRDALLAALRETGGNLSATARVLEKDRKQIQRWVKRFGLDPESFRNG
jgi:transcriptional regulator with AAA-type ATPase domain